MYCSMHRSKKDRILYIFLITLRITPFKRGFCEYVANVLSVKLKYLPFSEPNYINKQVDLNKIYWSSSIEPMFW